MGFQLPLPQLVSLLDFWTINSIMRCFGWERVWGLRWQIFKNMGIFGWSPHCQCPGGGCLLHGKTHIPLGGLINIMEHMFYLRDFYNSWFSYWLCSFYKYSTVEAFTALLYSSLPFQLHSWHRPRHQHLTRRHRRKRLQQKLLMVIHGKATGAWDAVYQTAGSQILDGLNESPKSSNIFDRRFKHTTGGLLC